MRREQHDHHVMLYKWLRTLGAHMEKWERKSVRAYVRGMCEHLWP